MAGGHQQGGKQQGRRGNAQATEHGTSWSPEKGDEIHGMAAAAPATGTWGITSSCCSWLRWCRKSNTDSTVTTE
ncbi:hypothetical protein G6F40_015307 [Rhizopus arrhizus]|nr:hypothetical protein G6F40_015307 [Rhizopus arrhizus]